MVTYTHTRCPWLRLWDLVFRGENVDCSDFKAWLLVYIVECVVLPLSCWRSHMLLAPRIFCFYASCLRAPPARPHVYGAQAPMLTLI